MVWHTAIFQMCETSKTCKWHCVICWVHMYHKGCTQLTGKISVNRFAINRSETDKMAANGRTSNPPRMVQNWHNNLLKFPNMS